jgi:dipeptidyl aminopeptidase/acylaminoacyl peptidase
MTLFSIIRRSAALAGAFIQFASAGEPVTEVRNGNIFLRPAEGAIRQLTTSGRDSLPVISPDGQSVVFARAVADKKIATGSGDVEAAELWQIRADGTEPERLVAPREAEDMKDVIASFSDIQFSTDGRSVFFVTPAYATSGAVHVVDLNTRKEHFVMAGSDLEVVRSGEYRDCLLVGQHRYFIGGGSYDWIWLFRPDGKEIGPVGESAENFKATYCQTEEKPGTKR